MNNLLHQVKLMGAGIPWLSEIRATGHAIFEQNGAPTPKTEAWKYTKPTRFLTTEFTINLQGRPLFDIPPRQLPFESFKVCFENGVFNPAASDLPQGIEVVPLIEAVMFRPDLRSKIGSLADMQKHPFAALNGAYMNEGVYIHIDSNVNITRPLALIYHVTAQDNPELYNLRNLIVIDENASAEIVEYYCYDGAVKSLYLVNVVNEIFIASGAKLNHYKLQDEAFKAGHLALNSIDVAACGCYKSFCLQKGGDLARNETEVFLSGEGAEAEVDAAYLMNGWATLDTTTDIKHLKPHTCSSQLVKGVVGGQAKGVFQGRIHIAPQAVKTEGYQLHKALLLTSEAEVDVKPELEIFADDVKCSHGAASGQLDAEQLFYMRSRGISEQDAKQLLIDAYLDDVIAKVDNEKIADWIKLSLKTNQSA